LDRTRQQHSL